MASRSPYIAEDTYHELFRLSGRRASSYLSIMYASRSFLKSWSEAFSLAGLKMAYMGPRSIGLITTLGETESESCFLLDMQKTKSRAYYIEVESGQVRDFAFPYGYSQFMNAGEERLNKKKIEQRLKMAMAAQGLELESQNAHIYVLSLIHI